MIGNVVVNGDLGWEVIFRPDGGVKIAYYREDPILVRCLSPEEWAETVQRMVGEDTPPQGHDFSWALAQMHGRRCVRRLSHHPDTVAYIYYRDENLVACSADGGVYGWRAPTQDLLATDWVLAEFGKENPNGV